VRPFSVLVSLGGFFLAGALCLPVYAAPLEFHAGLYTAYEYTDNYRGTTSHEQGESTISVGPTAQAIYTSGTSRLDLSGHAARRYHRKFSEDDSDDLLFDSRYAASNQASSLELGYGYVLNNQHTILSDVSGNSRRQTGSAGLTHRFSSDTSGGIYYNYYQENNPPSQEDIVSHGAMLTLNQQLTQRILLRMTNGYETHRYTIQSDAWVARSTLSLERDMTQRVNLGVSGEYEHTGQEEDDVPDSDITSAFINFRYAITPSTQLTFSGGYNWLTMEDVDREQAFATRSELRSQTPYGLLTVRVTREYAAEFTVDRYGIYEARSVYGTWERSLLRDLRLSFNITYEERKPVSGNDSSPVQNKEQDYSGLISLNWNPEQYEFLTVTPGYEHYERLREHTETEKENRYRVIVEVRY
jgi:hypothetical protein